MVHVAWYGYSWYDAPDQPTYLEQMHSKWAIRRVTGCEGLNVWFEGDGCYYALSGNHVSTGSARTNAPTVWLGSYLYYKPKRIYTHVRTGTSVRGNEVQPCLR
jgi:hypothetical protein